MIYPGDNDIQLVTFERLGPKGLINSFCPFQEFDLVSRPFTEKLIPRIKILYTVTEKERFIDKR